MTAGERLGAFALTEPGAGSDAAALALRAERTDGGYALTGSKIWITNGHESEMTIVFATVDRSRGREGITAFAVERPTDGFTRCRARAKDGDPRLGLGGARLRRRCGAGGEPAGSGGRRAQGGALIAGRRPDQYRCRLRGRGARRPGACRSLCAAADPVRPAHRRPGDDPGDARRCGHQGRGGAPPDLAGSASARRGRTHQRGKQHGQDVRVGRRHAR